MHPRRTVKEFQRVKTKSRPKYTTTSAVLQIVKKRLNGVDDILMDTPSHVLVALPLDPLP